MEIDNMEYYDNLLNSFKPKALNRGINRLNLKKDNINNQIDDLTNKKDELESQIEDNKQSIENYEIQISNLNSLLSNTNCEIDKLMIENQKCKEEQITFAKISVVVSLIFACFLAFTNKDINYALTDVYMALMIICILVIVKNSLSRKKCSNLNNKLTMQCENLCNDIQKYNDAIVTLKEDIKELEKKINEINQEIDARKLSLNESNVTISKLERRLDFLNVKDEFNKHSSKLDMNEILNYIFYNDDLRFFYYNLSKYFGYRSSYDLVKFITDYEMEFYKELKLVATRKKLHIESKVKLADIIGIGNVKNRPFRDEGKKNQTIDTYLYRINSKHVDFVLFDDDFYPVLCIELDDSSHFDFTKCNKENIKSHITKDLVFSYCRMSLLRIDNSNFNNLNQCIESAINNMGVSYFYSDENMKKFKYMLSSLQG